MCVIADVSLLLQAQAKREEEDKEEEEKDSNSFFGAIGKAFGGCVTAH